MSHTQGPWYLPHFVTAKGPDSCHCKYVLCESYMGAICEVHFEPDPSLSIAEGSGDNPPIEEAKANARLICAAPDLLAALKTARETVVAYIEDCGPCDHAVGICVCGLTAQLADIDLAIAKAEGV